MKPKEEPGIVVGGDAASVRDCWNQIGVMGDSSCGKLAEVAHCRNCPVYSTARAQLLDRQLPPDYRLEWTQRFSQSKPPLTTEKISVVVFRIAGEWLALSTQTFHEVTARRPIHSLPHRRNSVVLGLVNFRGELVICVSLARLLGIAQERGSEKSRQTGGWLMITEQEEGFLAFPVDEILGIHRHAPDELKALPATVANSGSNFTHGILSWQNHTVGCLDEDRLFSALNGSLA